MDDLYERAAKIAWQHGYCKSSDAVACAVVDLVLEEAAKWHDYQASALEAAIAQIIKDGGWIDRVRERDGQLHRTSAAAIRSLSSKGKTNG